MSFFNKGSFILYGYNFFGRSGYEKMASSKDFVDIYSNSVTLHGKSFLVTGANSGIGFDAAKYFALHGGISHLIVRNKERGEEAVKKILEEKKDAQVHLHVCDISEQSDIRKFAKSFIDNGFSLDVLVNNAGVMLDKKETASDGMEKTLATNTVSNFLLINLLLPVLLKSSDPRIIIVSSGGMLTEKLLIRDQYYKFKDDKYDGRAAYARTKKQQIALCELYAQKYGDRLKSYSMHPGWSDTPQVQTAMPGFYETFKDKFRSSQQGADTICWLAITDTLKPEDNGQFFRDRKHEIKNFCISSTRYGKKELQEFWNWLLELTNTKEGDLVPVSEKNTPLP